MTRNTFSTNNKGFSLLEAILVVTVMSIVLAAAAPNMVKGILNKYGAKTALDMTTIQEASRAYFLDTKTWPTGIADLTASGKYLPASWAGKNPFGQPYVISSTAASLTVTTAVQDGAQKSVANDLPASTISGTAVTSSIGTPMGASGMPVGVIIPWPSSTIPSGWLLCNGQAILRSTYSDLFASIGTTYGAGDGSTTFNIPDLRGRTVIGLDNMGGTNAGVITGGWGSTLGGKYGEEKHTLTIAEMPSHTHTMSSSGGSPGPAGMPNGVWPNGSIITTVTTDARGGSGAHNVIQPSIALEYIIKAQ